MPAREVYLMKCGKTVFVMYAQRRKGQRYSAAQFYDWTVEEVEDAVKSDPKLVLVPNPNN